MKSVEIKAPQRVGRSASGRNVFLAGSIEMGKAELWHNRVIETFPFNGVTFFNPRREDWGSSWVQDINNPNFYEQVSWELDMLDRADIIFVYFDPTTMSPITLLEVGLFSERVRYSHDKHMIVCCPEGYCRKGNVDIVCQFQGVPVFDNMETALIELKRLLN
jgi:hypothetical protein